MAKAAVEPFWFSKGVITGCPGRSRVVSCLAAPKGLAGIDYGFTTIVGQNVWLLSVQLWFFPAAVDVTKQVTFKVVTGTTAPVNQAQILQWDSVIPLVWKGAGADVWTHYLGQDHYEWSMEKLYIGEGRRFGIWAQCNWDGLDQIYASFQVSEG